MDKTLSPALANLYALVLAPFVLVAFFLPHVLFWGQASLQGAFDRLLSPFLILLALGLIAHELLHGIGFTLAGRPLSHDDPIGGSPEGTKSAAQ